MSFEPLSRGPVAELVVPYDGSRLEEKLQRRRAMMRSRLISLVITVAVLAVIYLWQRDKLHGAGFLAVYGLVLGVSLAWFVVFLVGYLQARRDTADLGQGVAVRVAPQGVTVGATSVGWAEVASLAVVRRRGGRSSALQLTTTSGATSAVPLDQITEYPATIDSAARAFSAGRHGVDLTALDN